MDSKEAPKKNPRARLLVRRLTYSAIMIALSVILTRVPFFTFYFPGATWLRVGFGSVPIVISSLVCGPFWGLLVGGASDVIGAILAPMGDYYFGYTIDSALEGVLPWLLMELVKGRKKTEVGTYLFLAAFITVISISFCSIFSVFKKQEIVLWARILIHFGHVLVFVIFAFLLFFLPKTETFRSASREENRYSLMDIFLTSLINEALVGMCLKSVWNYMYMQIPFLYSAFSDSLIFFVAGPIKTLVTFFIINALFKADSSMKRFKDQIKAPEVNKRNKED